MAANWSEGERKSVRNLTLSALTKAILIGLPLDSALGGSPVFLTGLCPKDQWEDL